jgi:hypothetical protein
MPEFEPQLLVTERQETEVNLCLAGAQLALMNSDYRRAEKLYKRALQWARQRWGAESANVGNILLELQELYTIQGMVLEAEKLEEQVNIILRHYFFSALKNMTSRKP